ncbi:unnamed protein product [Allacma fusca]|uniref:Uncharacterized protein n=1 Tax=Allacma fusca TaxID=39272 RepID=A0A8J2JEC2_9HEXA|nr:unnamed protein product [Allacma fusca]
MTESKQRRQWNTPSEVTNFDRTKIIFLPMTCYIGALVMLGVFIFRPDGNQFLFSIIPRRYQTWWAFSLFLLVETLAAVSVATTVMFQHVIQVVMMKSSSDILLQNWYVKRAISYFVLSEGRSNDKKNIEV